MTRRIGLHDVSAGLCECGCGERTRIAACSDKKRGHVKGQPYRFVAHHSVRRYQIPRDEDTEAGGGYVARRAPGHPRERGGRVRVHILVAEAALGRYLVYPEQVHHVDRNPKNNAPDNLVICQDFPYHHLLHMRTRAYEATGNPRLRKCTFCGVWDQPDNMIQRKERGRTFERFIHLACRRKVLMASTRRYRARRAQA